MSERLEAYGVPRAHEDHEPLSLSRSIFHDFGIRSIEARIFRREAQHVARLYPTAKRVAAHRHRITQTDDARLAALQREHSITGFQRPPQFQAEGH